MLIKRVQIEDGFLDGLDIQFMPGLNVLIGARGTGKTSLIELIRFGLGGPAFTEDAKSRGNYQALSVLQGGQVTLELSDGEDHFVVTRGARDEAPRSSRPIPHVTVLAQSEIEAVGAQSSGRLQLIDRFRFNQEEDDKRSSLLTSTLRSLTAEIGGVLDELRIIDDQIQEMRTVRNERIEAVEQQQDLLKSIDATASEREELTELQRYGAMLTVRSDVFARMTGTLNSYRKELQRIALGLQNIEEWPESAGAIDQLEEVRSRSIEAAQELRAAIEIINGSVAETRRLNDVNSENRVTTDEKARASRRTLDNLRVGAGSLARRVELLTEREAQLGALEERAKDRKTKIRELQMLRRKVFEEFEEMRAERFTSRMQVANRLKTELSPGIEIELIESGMVHGYRNAIAASLRGSGLHYNTLAPLFATHMSPLELVEAVEADSSQAIIDAAEIAPDRATNVINHLQKQKLTDVITAPIDDAVELSLLDGSDYKKSGNLSIGQRCTVVLPILLTAHGEILIIDQPEDHLDNAFITETLVERLRKRQDNDQFILASHNANVPVLGDADLVVRLGSDGRRGFVEHLGQLDAPKTVEAITSLMEGGVEAFRRRAMFYQGVLDDGHGH